MINKESKKVKIADGTVLYYWENKLHNWDGPSKINPDGTKEYYLHGIKLSEEDYKKRLKERTGLPFYKAANFKQRG